ncbi:MAG: hypothetical protein ACO3FN_11950, partial [Vulcanococcus sp.]
RTCRAPNPRINDMCFTQLEQAMPRLTSSELAVREGKGALQVDGRLVDLANIRMAQNLVQRADAIGGL